jgi:hypothetical protein
MYRASRIAAVTHFSTILPALTFVGLWGGLLPFHPLDRESAGVLVWWSALCAVSIFNIWLWRQSAGALARRKTDTDPVIHGYQRWQLVLCAVYVFGCAFRSLLPRGDVQRIGLLDSWVSCALLGRSVATVAELCFAAQWALWLRQTTANADSRFAVAVSWLLVPLIVVAEMCSWYGVLTTAYIGNVIEESIWAFAASLIVISCLASWRRCPTGVRTQFAAVILCGFAFVIYMCTVDVPMYAGRWLADEASGKTYLSLSQGLWDAGSRWSVTHSWDEWQAEILWMSLYFSLGVWSSIALVHAPDWERLQRHGRRGPSGLCAITMLSR